MLPHQHPGPALGVLPCSLGLTLFPDGPDTTETDQETHSGGHDVEEAKYSLGGDVESDDDADPLTHIEQRVLDWVEDSEDEGEADGVVDGVTEGGDDEVLAEIVEPLRTGE